MKKIFLIFTLIILPFAYAEQPAQIGKLLNKQLPTLKETDQTIVLIYLYDKGNPDKVRSTLATSLISERSANRRMMVRGTENIIDTQDLPLEPLYVQEVSKHVVQVRHELKWFNAISVVATKHQIETLRQLPYVKEIELVGRWRSKPEREQESIIKESSSLPSTGSANSLDYGTSITQVNQINVPVVHNLGIYGQGVVVGVFDNGFRLLTHEAFSSMHIIAQHDFVDHKESVVPNNPSTGFGSHGVNTLSTIGGYKPGQLIGPAFKSDFILARTENDSSETPIEEDNWAAAIQWADSIGVDVTSTSLGYFTYDAPYTSWTWQDMNGNTTLITKAADRAVSLGIVVVNSAGNDAARGTPNTLIAPADGDSVIAAGAVNSAGVRTSFSSYGPTFDGRIKPDIMAMGSGVKVASSTNTTGYGSASGTSFSCPLSAGVAALIRCANPKLTPMQVREAMRQTANNAASPNNLMGWGILNADSAIKYYGALPLGHIRGTVFNDINGNGVKDVGEPPIAGVKIRIVGTKIDSTLTDTLGNFSFDSLAIGNFIITEDVSAGWIQTLPVGNYSVNLLHGIDTSGFNFGNFRLGTIHGIAFDDTNHNGIRDIGEPGSANWVFTLSGPNSYHAVSNTAGNFIFTDIGPGTYTLSESSQVGWFQTVPINYGSYTITVSSGLDSSGFIFGNYNIPNQTYSVLAGWNMLSLPNKMNNHNKYDIYPSTISDAFIYQGSYIPLDTIPEKDGFWLKSDTPQSVIFQGVPRVIDTIDVNTGWNLIGSLSLPVAISSIIQIPDSIILSSYYNYGRACSYYYTYCMPDTLKPHNAYWVKSKSNGKLVFNALSSNQFASTHSRFQEFLPPSSSIIISDKNGNKRTLYIDLDEKFTLTKNMFELPPPPPEGVFDVRFADGSTLAIREYGKSKTIPILISSASYPITVKWNIQDVHNATALIINGEKVNMKSFATCQLIELVPRMELKFSPSSINETPKEFALQQNYPNPFNPTTEIHYQIAAPSCVTLKVYNIFGQEVRTLVDEMQTAGYKSAEFNASNLASGIYFYKLTAGPFVDVKKMTILK